MINRRDWPLRGHQLHLSKIFISTPFNHMYRLCSLAALSPSFHTLLIPSHSLSRGFYCTQSFNQIFHSVNSVSFMNARFKRGKRSSDANAEVSCLAKISLRPAAIQEKLLVRPFTSFSVDLRIGLH